MATIAAVLAEFCNGRYAKLKHILANVPAEDVVWLQKEDLVHAAKDHELLMIAFYHQLCTKQNEWFDIVARLSPRLTNTETETYLATETATEIQNTLKHQLKVFDGSKRFMDNALDCVFVHKRSVKSISVEELHHYQVLRLSHCQLYTSETLTSIRNLVRHLGSISYLDLSWNQFSSKDTWRELQCLLEIEHIKVVNIVGNPICFPLNGKLLRHLTKKHLRKLIWLQKCTIDHNLWISMLQPEPDWREKVSIVYALHWHFYNTICP